MRSPIKSSQEARYSSAFWSRIFVKDYIFSCLSARNLGGNLHVKSKDLNGPEIYLRFYFLKIFLAVGNILNKISPKDLPMVCFVVTQHSESALSLCLRYSKTSCARATKNHPSNIRLNWHTPLFSRHGIIKASFILLMA